MHALMHSCLPERFCLQGILTKTNQYFTQTYQYKKHMHTHTHTYQYKKTQAQPNRQHTHSHTLKHIDFFQGQGDRGLFIWPNLSRETRLSKEEEVVQIN